jgi:hypothetical protein
MEFAAGQKFRDPAGLVMTVLDLREGLVRCALANPATGGACTIADEPANVYRALVDDGWRADG